MPQHWVKREWRGSYRGQKQIWYLLRLVGRDTDVRLRASEHPEFDAWRWHDYWVPLETVIEFKREVYRRALTELERYLHVRPQTRRERLFGMPHPVMPQSYSDPTIADTATDAPGARRRRGPRKPALAQLRLLHHPQSAHPADHEHRHQHEADQ